MKIQKTVILLIGLLVAFPSQGNSGSFWLGAGKSDITGPAAERGMLGYGLIEQKTAGIHTRLFARAFHISTTESEILMINCDLGMISPAVYQGLLEKLNQLYPNRFTEHNVMVQATHTHSGPGGYFFLPFYNLSTLGFSKLTYNAILLGTLEAIDQAIKRRVPGKITISQGELIGVSTNRSLTAYKANPDHSKYQHNTNKLMTQIQFWSEAKKPLGVYNWFSVHPVSMGNQNRLISGDNKGHASFLFEKKFSSINPHFVAAFANSDQGDVSPNIMARTNASNDTDLIRTELSGTKQFEKAKVLFDDKKQEALSPKLKSITTWIDMPKYKVRSDFTQGRSKKLCHGAMGQSFAAGAEDGPSGMAGFFEGMKVNSTKTEKKMDIGFWSKLANWLRPLFQGGDEHEKCHAPKPILLTTGHPYLKWTAERLPFQLITIGELAIATIPGELTTMAGRRLRTLISKKLKTQGIKQVVLAGLANSYSGYIATYEEYQIQHYEGASTLYGPHTSNAYLQIYNDLTNNFIKLPKGPKTSLARSFQVLDKIDKFNIQTGVVFDRAPVGEDFGSLIASPKKNYKEGEFAQAVFRSGHPKNSIDLLNTFAEVQMKTKGRWQTIASDHDPNIIFEWGREKVTCLGCSQAKITWKIDKQISSGPYRIVHFGHYKSAIDGKNHSFTGKSNEFQVYHGPK